MPNSQKLITQVLLTIQGEGNFTGTPVVLIRFGRCNLNCEFCDAKWSNEMIVEKKENHSSPPFWINPNDLALYIVNKIKDTKISTIMLTGGEPLLHSQYIDELLYNLSTTQIKSVQLETNGTLVSSNLSELLKYPLDFQIAVSPKLEPAYYPQKISFTEIINTHISCYQTLKNLETLFSYKFVYSSKWQNEIEYFIKHVEIESKYVSLLPLTEKRSEFDSSENFFESFRKSCLATINYSIQSGYRYSPREHLFIFGDDVNETID